MRGFVIIAIVLLVATIADATIRLDAVCDSGAIRVDLQLSDYSSRPGPDWAAVVVYRRVMGSTEAPAPMAGGEFAWPLDDAEYLTMQLFDDDIEDRRGYLYYARAIDADGEEHDDGIPGAIDAWASCGGDYPIGRGVLDWEVVHVSGSVTYVRGYFDPVCEGYWGQPGLCPEMEMEAFLAQWQDYIGHTLEVRGHYAYTGMPTDCFWDTSEVVPIVDCDGEVRTAPSSWSAIKRLYD